MILYDRRAWVARRTAKFKFHKWFAWYPVKCARSRNWIWLEHVWCRRKLSGDEDRDTYWLILDQIAYDGYLEVERNKEEMLNSSTITAPTSYAASYVEEDEEEEETVSAEDEAVKAKFAMLGMASKPLLANDIEVADKW